MPQGDTPNDRTFQPSRLGALINWFCTRSEDAVLVLDLTSETVFAGGTKAASLLPLKELTEPVAMSNVFTADAIAAIRFNAVSELQSPFLRSTPANAQLWKFERLIPGDLGVLFRPVGGDRNTTNGGSEPVTDELTGFSSRGSLTPFLQEALARYRDLGAAFAVLFLDFDHFKRINDEYGHLAGDEVLRRAAAEILHTIRPGDRAVRYGGDEYVIVIGGLHSANEALSIARRVRDAAGKSLVWRESTLEISASVGVAYVAANDSTVESVLERADQAMYRAKNLGRCGKIEVD